VKNRLKFSGELVACALTLALGCASQETDAGQADSTGKECTVVDSTTQVVSFNGQNPGSMTTDSRRLYVAVDELLSEPRYSVVSVPLPCGKPTVLTERGGSVYGSIELADGTLYWIDNTGLLSMPVEGGTVTTLAHPATSTVDLPVFAVRGDSVYWADDEGGVWKVPVAGGDAVKLASNPGTAAGAIAVDDSNVYWAALSPEARSDSGTIRPGAIMKVPVAGGSVTTLVAGQESPDSLLLTPTDLYYANGGGYGVDAPGGPGAVLTLPLSGGSPSVLSSDEVSPASLERAGDSLYWATGSGQMPRSIRAWSLTDHALQTIVPAPRTPGFVDLATSSDSVFWRLDDENSPPVATIFSMPAQ
jgi:hypothetical protein